MLYERNANFVVVYNTVQKFIKQIEAKPEYFNSGIELIIAFYASKNKVELLKTSDSSKFFIIDQTDYMLNCHNIDQVFDVVDRKFIYGAENKLMDIVKLAYGNVYDKRFNSFYMHTKNMLLKKADVLFHKLVENFNTIDKKELLEFINIYYFGVIAERKIKFQVDNNSHESVENCKIMIENQKILATKLNGVL